MSWKKTIDDAFPRALPGPEMTERVIEHLDGELGFTAGNTLFGYATCPDELNRAVTSFGDHYGENFPLGGLAGYPFAGVSGFEAFASHAPAEGHLLILYGPHVGVDAEGRLGRVIREGMEEPTPACGSLMGAYHDFRNAWEQGVIDVPRFDELDQQQTWIGTLLVSHMKRVLASDEPALELVEVAWALVDEAFQRILEEADLAFAGRIALVGGVQINTPAGSPSRFDPRRLELVDLPKGSRRSWRAVLP